MIEWMQRHRKYLVITIWISTIAFVGAGFVGWGAYSFGNDKASSIAKVGNRNITVKEFQMAYSNTYSYYNNLLNGGLTKEKAQEMGLEQNVLQNLINETLLLNYADEIGLNVLDSDIKTKLANDTIFQKDGVFNLNQYKMVLKNIGISANEYEKNLKRDILLEKLSNILTLQPKNELIDLLSSSLFMEDKLSIQILHANPNDIDMNETKLKAFWEPIKDNFKTIKTYDILTDFVSYKDENASDDEIKAYYDEKKFNFTDKDGKIKSLEDAKDDVTKEVKLSKSKKSALRKYLDVKNGKVKLTKKETINENMLNYPIAKLATANPNTTLKPFKQDDGYIIVQLIKTDLPKTMSFEEAKKNIERLYSIDEAKKILTNRAKTLLDEKKFNGTDVGFVSRDINRTIDGLNLNETQYFANKLFDKTTKEGYVLFDNKVVIYDILAQKLLNKEKVKEYNKELTQMAQKLEDNQMQSSLLDELRKRYKIEQYYKGN